VKEKLTKVTVTELDMWDVQPSFACGGQLLIHQTTRFGIWRSISYMSILAPVPHDSSCVEDRSDVTGNLGSIHNTRNQKQFTGKFTGTRIQRQFITDVRPATQQLYGTCSCEKFDLCSSNRRWDDGSNKRRLRMNGVRELEWQGSEIEQG
jgi:hypothetical protein